MSRVCESMITSINYHANGIQEYGKPARKDRQISSSSMSDYSCDPYQDESHTAAASVSIAAMERYLKHKGDSHHLQSLVAPSIWKEASPGEEGTTPKSCRNGWSWRILCQWSRIQRSIRRGKLPSTAHRRLTDTDSTRQGQSYIDHTHGLCYAYVSGFGHCSQQDGRPLSTSLSQKYQPKVFGDIVGHEIVIRAISNAVQNRKVASLYLFHGPTGTGKTSTAILFAIGLHCGSTTHNKPCWSCKGCYRSLYNMELCTGSGITGFRQINTLLQSTSFTNTVPGFKVFIIKECHLLTMEAWEELLAIVQGRYDSSVIFVLVTVDANTIPATVSSRCQKFYFQKLKNIDITLKIAKIVAQEGIEMEQEAMKLIVAKAEGSLREAQNILDQLTLLGQRITAPMVQQIVGLAPENQINNLLATALSGDTKNTIIATRELISTGIEPRAIVSQLASLITDVLPGNTQSERLCYALKILVETEKQSTSSIYAALIQIASQDVSSRIPLANLLLRDIVFSSGSFNKTSKQHSIRRTDLDTSEPLEETMQCRGKTVETESMGDMEVIWLNMLQKIQSTDMKEFLHRYVKLASLTVSSANAIVHLMFRKPEDKMAAQMSEDSISNALKKAIGVPVMVNMSLEPVDFGRIEEHSTSIKECQVAEYNHSRQQQRTPFLPEFVSKINSGAVMHPSTHQKSAPPDKQKNMKLKYSRLISVGQDGCPKEVKESKAWHEQMSPFSGLNIENQSDATNNLPSNALVTNQFPITDSEHFIKTEKPKHRWQSLSSIQHSDASVEPYSQDIMFEIGTANTEKERRARRTQKLQNASSKAYEDRHSQDGARSIGLHRSWSCKAVFCQKTKERTMKHDC